MNAARHHSNGGRDMLLDEHLQVGASVVIVDNQILITTEFFPILLENGFESPGTH
jgi:hypothetical protein